MKKMRKAFVIMNESHSLLPEQEKILEEKFEEYEIISVPATGWTLEEMKKKAESICYKVAGAEVKDMGKGRKAVYFPAESPGNAIIFVSPIPYLLKELTARSIRGDYEELTTRCVYDVLVFHNDNREKKELPDGRIIQVVAKEGWQLV
mgnify:CR=1 FL=1